MTPQALRQQAQAWLEAGVPVIVVTVQETQGSTPREVGARMLVTAHTACGTVGGGHLEWQAMAAAREALLARARHLDAAGDGGPADWTQRLSLGPSLGQCCGGTVVLRWQVLTPQVLDGWPEPVPLAEVWLFGAGHVGRAVVELLGRLPVAVRWMDTRDEAWSVALTSATEPMDSASQAVLQVVTDTPEADIAQAPAGAYYLVMTHSHALDLVLVEAILRRGDAAYVGLIGSATKRARFEHRLLDRGLSVETVASMACPIGLPGLKGKAPEMVALSVVADLMQRVG